MKKKILDNLYARFQAYMDRIKRVDAQMLTARIDAPRRKSLGEHLWCVVGARESYAKAIAAGQWVGFDCSMSTLSHQDFLDKLEESAQAVRNAIECVDDWTSEREDLLATLAEHEVMHEGQIIRHVYGTGGTLPASWKWA